MLFIRITKKRIDMSELPQIVQTVQKNDLM